MVLGAEGCRTDKSHTASRCRPSRHHEDPLSAHCAGPGCVLSLRPGRYVFSWLISLGNYPPEGLRICFGIAEGKGQHTMGQQGGNTTNCSVFFTDAKPSSSESDKGTGGEPGRASALALTLSPKPPGPLAFCLGVPTFPPKSRIT